MGIYDRDYYRQQRPSSSLGVPRTAVVTLIAINAALYLANGLLTSKNNQITDVLAAHGDTLARPLMWWQLLSYGFVHSSEQFTHILFNMLGLWFLGRDVELRYGKKEFLKLYLVMLVVGSLAWAVVNRIGGVPADPNMTLFGASGAIAGVVVLFALNFPRRTILFMFVLPMPAWLLGVLLVVGDILGATGSAGPSNVAYVVHLAGAAFAFVYYHQGWNLGRVVEGRFSRLRLKPRPKLRIHDPQSDDDDLSEEVDRILEKIHRQGEASLTRKERRTLETASREYQKRRQG